MNELPKISIITPSFNQGEYLAETLQSLADQDYPYLEVIIQEGGSTDASVEIGRDFCHKYPNIFQLHSERDHGQGDALNRGFKKATGAIFGFLNSDDCLEKGCLHRVAKEINPSVGRWIVCGRTLFFGNDPSKEDRDHPLEYTSHFDQLAIWKRQYNQIPQPSTFWHRNVWENCGGIDLTVEHAVDYDLFCRFSQRYHFHKVPEIWSRYRLHDDSKTVNKSHNTLIEECIEISRRYWGSWLTPLRWRCEFSHWLYQRSRRTEAIVAVRKAEYALHQSSGGFRTFFLSCLAAWSAPLAFAPRLLFPIAATRGWTRFARRFQESPPTELCPNQWIGPFFETELPIPPAAKSIRIQIEIPEAFLDTDFEVTVSMNGTPYRDWNTVTASQWVMSLPAIRTEASSALVAISSNQYFIPLLTGESEDTRFLSLQLVSLETLQ